MRVLSMLLLSLASAGLHRTAAAADPPPNVVIIFTDDQGYGDVGCFGAEGFETPNLDRMATEGMRFTNFYVSQAVCTASRAALLTGCYNVRVGLDGALGPSAQIGLHPDETTFAELAKSSGYATAMVGKWHLGHHEPFLPTSQGFDSYYGLPYSNDMWPDHPNQDALVAKGRGYPPLPMYENTHVVDEDVTAEDQTQLITDYTERSVAFIEKSGDRPFLLYLAHSLPHVPLFVSDMFAGTQPAGLYGDVIREIDWSVGQVLDALKRTGVDERTLVIFCSDNGPWLAYGDHAGTTAGLREGKGTSFEGGVRTPTIMRYPGQIPAGSVCETPAMTIDILPTIAGLIGARPPERTIDGADLWALMTGHPQAASPHKALFFYWGGSLEAVRVGDFKMHYPHGYRSIVEVGTGGQPGRYKRSTIEKSLFDLGKDPAETTNVLREHPEIEAEIDRLADAMRAKLGDRRTKQTGAEVRSVGRLGR